MLLILPGQVKIKILDNLETEILGSPNSPGQCQQGEFDGKHEMFGFYLNILHLCPLL